MTNFEFIIRPATHDDYGCLCELFEELDALHRTARPELFFAPAGAVRDLNYVRELIDGPRSTILVASPRHASEAVQSLYGLATLIIRTMPAVQVRRARRFLEVDNFVVRTGARRQGVGRALMNAAIAWSRTEAIGAVELAVHEFNTGALAFYEAVGFKTQGRRMACISGDSVPAPD